MGSVMAEASVILLNFNGGELTAQAIDSLLNQVGTSAGDNCD